MPLPTRSRARRKCSTVFRAVACLSLLWVVYQNTSSGIRGEARPGLFHAPPHQAAPAAAANSVASKLHSKNGAAVYYKKNTKYWNDYKQVQAHIKKMSTGDEAMFWLKHLLLWNGNKPFKKALMLSCGNGWVERDMANHGLIQDAVGIDVSDGLLKVARSKASELELGFRYYVFDSNTNPEFPEDGFDLVVNHAALHHVAFLDLHLRAIVKLLLPNNGTLVNFDYQGAHRNQYPAQQWYAAKALNEQLPPHLQRETLKTGYPSLREMLRTDPSEAIHSELTLAVMRRYFQPAWYRQIGGALAYPVLTHNKGLAQSQNASEVAATIKLVLAEDEKFTQAHPNLSMFFYSIEKPKPGCLDDPAQLEAWTQEEVAREKAAAANGGVYYPQTEISLQVYGALNLSAKGQARGGL